MSVKWLEVLVFPGSIKEPSAEHIRSLKKKNRHYIVVNRLSEPHHTRFRHRSCKQGQHLLTHEKVVCFLEDVPG